MSITNHHKLSQEPQDRNLSVEQLNAIDILVQGRSDEQTGLAVGVVRETVTRWRNDNPHFAAELNRQRRLAWGGGQDRLRSLVNKAVDTIDAGLDAGDRRIAVEVLKMVGLYGQITPPSGPVDPEAVLLEQAREWAAREIAKKGPSDDPLLDLVVRDTELTRLTRHRLEELTKAQGDLSM